MKSIKLFDIPIHQVTRQEAAEIFIDFCQPKFKDDIKIFTATPNAEILLEALNDTKLKAYLQQCRLNVADSVSLLWASEVQTKNWGPFRSVLELILLPLRKKYWQTLPERVSGADLFLDICQEAAKKEYKIFLLGGSEGIAQQTKKSLLKKFPLLNVVGAIAGSPQPDDDTVIRNKIIKAQPDIIFVAYGCPKQEHWIARNLPQITGVKIAMGIGGTFDFVTGKIKRAPEFIRHIGLEWLWRLFQEPRKRTKRIFRAIMVFPWVFLKSRSQKK